MDNEELLSRYRELQEYVGWTDEDAARVRKAGPLVESALPALVDDFYAEIKRHPNANKVFVDEAQVARLKVSLKVWLNQLFRGPYDADYLLRRWQVGRRHVEVGLDHIYAAAALSRLRQGLVRAVRANWPADWDDVSETIDSLRTLIDLDLAIIEDSYAIAYQERLQRGERLAAIGQIAAGVAHELRNPLNVVKTSAYFLLNAKTLSPERVSEHLRRINRQVNHANDVITALASFAKPPDPHLNSISVIDCVKGALDRYPLPQGISLVSDLPATLPKVNADATQLGIVFGNLVRNACDAMPTGGTLTVSGASSDGVVEVRVSDTGQGIEPDNLAKLTEPLFSTKTKGMGLGLAITHTILSKISGKLQVTSELGRGAHLRFEYQWQRALESTAMKDDTVRSILIVDDEVDACENLRDILVDLGYRVGIARNGPEAIEQMRRSDYDLALLDLKMPGMDGVSVYREIKRLHPETAAIVVSAFSGSELAERALEEGASGVVAKPVDVPELLTAIATSLAQPLVLVVDDDADFCHNLWQILNAKGYRVALAQSAGEAHRQLAAKSFDVVLIDLRLRGSETGEDVLRIVADTNPKARRVLVTGFREGSLETIRNLLDHGVDAVCYKPIDVDNLMDMLSGRRSDPARPIADA